MSESQITIDKNEINWFWKEVGADIVQTLSPDQRAAIEDAVKKSSARSQPADLRLHLGKYFLRVIAGTERRNRERLREDRKNNPVFIAKNLPLLILYWILLLFSTLYALAFTVNLLAYFGLVQL